MTRPVLLSTLFLFLTGASCQKDELPEPSQEGKNTFGCLVDGKLFVPKGSSFGGPILQVNHADREQGNFICISAKMKGEGDCGLSYLGFCIIKDVMKEGESFAFSTEGSGTLSGRYGYFPTTCTHQEVEYHTTEELAGSLTITKLDWESHIFSGTFWFNAVNEGGGMVEVREGVFDVEF